MRLQKQQYDVRLNSRWILLGAATLILWFSNSFAADVRCVSSIPRVELRQLAAALPNDPDDPSTSSRPVWGPEIAEAVKATALEASYCSSALMAGTLNAGDARRFAAFLSDSPFLQRLYLNADGTDLNEGDEIGNLVRQRKLRTIAPLASEGDGRAILIRHNLTKLEDLCESEHACKCAGACVLIWASGVERTGNALTLGTLVDALGSYIVPRSTISGDQATSADGREVKFLEHMGVTRALRERLRDMGGRRTAFPESLDVANDRYPQEMTDILSTFCGPEPRAVTFTPDIRAPLRSFVDRRAALRRSASTWRSCSDTVLLHLTLAAGPFGPGRSTPPD